MNCRTALGGNEVRRVANEKQAVVGKEGGWEGFGKSKMRSLSFQSGPGHYVQTWTRARKKSVLTSWLGILLIREAGGVPVSRIIC